MNTAPDKLPTILGVSKRKDFNQAVERAATAANCFFQSIETLSAWSDMSDLGNRLCLVVDYDSPAVFDAPQAIIRLREVMALLVVIDADDTDAAFHASCMGALMLVHRPVDIEKLAETFSKLFQVQHGGINEQELGKSILVQQFQKLTDREKVILRRLMRGEPNKQIASQLDISLRTVESERANLMRAFGVGSFAQLIRRATIAIEQMRLIRAQAFGVESDPNATLPTAVRELKPKDDYR